MDLRTKEEALVEELQVAQSDEVGWNFLITDQSSIFTDEFLQAVFGPIPREAILIRPSTFDMFDILVEMQAFKSRSDAKKNWKKSDKDIEHGCHSFLVSKKKTPLFIFRPITTTP